MKRLRKRYSLALLLWAASAFGQSNYSRDCDGNDDDLSIAGCTVLIKAAQAPDSLVAKAYNNRAVAYLDKRDYKQAISDFSEAIRLDPEYPDAYNGRGLAYTDDKEYGLAIRDLREAISLDPNSVSPLINLGHLYIERDEFENAVRDLTRAIELEPQNAMALYNRGAAYAGLQEYDQAIADQTLGIRINPNDAGALSNRGSTYFAVGDYGRALQDFNTAIRLNSRSIRALNNRGLLYLTQGQFAASKNDFENALRVKPDDRDVILHVYAAQLRGGNRQTQTMQASMAKLPGSGWPSPIIEMFLGKITPQAMLATAHDSDTKKDMEQLCVAYFYLGERALSDNKPDEARTFFLQSINSKAPWRFEWNAARAEVNRLSKIGHS